MHIHCHKVQENLIYINVTTFILSLAFRQISKAVDADWRVIFLPIVTVLYKPKKDCGDVYLMYY